MSLKMLNIPKSTSQTSADISCRVSRSAVVLKRSADPNIETPRFSFLTRRLRSCELATSFHDILHLAVTQWVAPLAWRLKVHANAPLQEEVVPSVCLALSNFRSLGKDGEDVWNGRYVSTYKTCRHPSTFSVSSSQSVISLRFQAALDLRYSPTISLFQSL